MTNDIDQIVLDARQIRLALLASGVSLEDVDVAISLLPEESRKFAEISWGFGAEFPRNSELVIVLGSILGLEDEHLDTLFILGLDL